MTVQTLNCVWKQYMSAAILNIIQMVNGFSVSWSASMVLKLIDAKTTPLSRVATETEVVLITNIMFIGIVGAYVSSYLSNHIGRKYCFILGGFIYCFSYLILTLAVSTSMIIAGRLLVGFSLGFIQILIYIYVGEIASPNIRGIVMTSLSIFQCTGCLIGFCLGPYLSYLQFGFVPIILIIIFIALSFFLNESPVYFVIKGDEEAAKKALNYFGRSKDVNYELKIMLQNAKENAQGKRKWLELFQRSNRRALLIIIPLYIIEQASGVIAVILNATAIFKLAGSSIEPAVATMIVGVTNLTGSLISPFVVDRYGRKVLLLFSAGGCCLAMTALGTYFYFRQMFPESVGSLGWLPLTALVAALFTYSVGLTIIPHALAGEMFSPKMRGLGTSLGLTVANGSGLITTSIYSYLAVNVGIHYAFWMFAVFDLVGVIFTIYVVPETKGKSLSDINAMLAK